MDRRGIELTMSTIIIAAIAILVLIVIIVIFTNSTGNFWRGTTACESAGGECQSGRCDEGYSTFIQGNPECQSTQGEGSVCCKRNEAILGLGE